MKCERVLELENDLRELQCVLLTKKRYIKEAHDLIGDLKKEIKAIDAVSVTTRRFLEGSDRVRLDKLARGLSNSALYTLIHSVTERMYLRLISEDDE